MGKAMRTALSLGIGISGGYALYRFASRVLSEAPLAYILTVSISVPLVICSFDKKETIK